jgi:sulfoxide reductase heme-binding subunit YedZ
MSALATSSSKLDWYLTRSTGAVALVLLTTALALGVADLRRWSTSAWPRFAIDALHRSVSLLALAFLALHILTSVIDGFVSISPLAAVVPFVSSYRPFWLGLGAVACDLLLAVILTSLLRRRIGHAGWRAAHWLVYACWPIALLHALGTGSDLHSAWLQVLAGICTAVVATAVCTRVLTRPVRLRRARLGAQP